MSTPEVDPTVMRANAAGPSIFIPANGPNPTIAPLLTVISRGELIAPGWYPVHSVFRRVINFSAGDYLVALADESVGAGPLTIGIRGLLPEQANRLEVGPGRVRLDGRALDTTRAVPFGGQPSGLVPRTPAGRRRSRRNRAVLEDILLAGAPPHTRALLPGSGHPAGGPGGFERALAARLADGARQLCHGDPAEGVRLLRGCGPGLTPAGDDFLAGFLLGLRFRQPLASPPPRDLDDNLNPGGENETIDRIYRLARGGNPFSNTALYLAWRGRVNESVANLLRALGTGGPEEIRRAAAKVREIGASSGVDFTAGFLAVWKLGKE